MENYERKQAVIAQREKEKELERKLKQGIKDEKYQRKLIDQQLKKEEITRELDEFKQ